MKALTRLFVILSIVMSQTVHAIDIDWYLSTANSNVAPLNVKNVYLGIDRAMSSWSNRCNVRFNFRGFTDSAPLPHHSHFNEPSFKTVIGWQHLTSHQNNLSAATVLITDLNTGDVVEAHLALGLNRHHTNEEWYALMLHEIGHLIGLNHLTEPGAVMSYPYSTLEIMQKLQKSDILACSQLQPTWIDFSRQFN